MIDYVRDWRLRGGQTALVTASDQSIADQIAAHLDLFDEVHGSTGTENLKGPVKADFLQDRFGAGGFAYMGDSPADLPVWRRAAKAVTVNAAPALRQKAERAASDTEHLATAEASPAAYVRALRPHQWLKNVLVFLPMLAAHQLDMVTLMQSLLAFLSFSLIASSVYVVNDLLDLNADRAHPRKRFRPFAAGRIPIEHGSWMAAALFLGGLAAALPLGLLFLGVILLYYAMTTAYSLHFKRMIVMDICLLAGLYTIRIAAGGAATGIPLSVWLLAFSIFFFFSLAAVKRQAELVDSAKRQQLTAKGRGYHVDDLPVISMIAIAAGYVSVLVLALYLNSCGGGRALHHSAGAVGNLLRAALLDHQHCDAGPPGPDAGRPGGLCGARPRQPAVLPDRDVLCGLEQRDMTVQQLLIRYTAFAAAATAVNLATQRAVLQLGRPAPISLPRWPQAPWPGWWSNICSTSAGSSLTSRAA